MLQLLLWKPWRSAAVIQRKPKEDCWGEPRRSGRGFRFLRMKLRNQYLYTYFKKRSATSIRRRKIWALKRYSGKDSGSRGKARVRSRYAVGGKQSPCSKRSHYRKKKTMTKYCGCWNRCMDKMRLQGSRIFVNEASNIRE